MSEELKFHQVAYVVKDLDSSVRHWADNLGIGPWTVYTLKAPGLRDCIYKGEKTQFSLRHAMAFSGTMQFELVQPLDGPSIFKDQLNTTGEGMNHVGCIVQDHPAAVADFSAIAGVGKQGELPEAGNGVDELTAADVDSVMKYARKHDIDYVTARERYCSDKKSGKNTAG